MKKCTVPTVLLDKNNLLSVKNLAGYLESGPAGFSVFRKAGDPFGASGGGTIEM